MKKLLVFLAVFLPLTVFGASDPFNITLTLRQAISLAQVRNVLFGTLDVTAGTYTVTATTGPHTAGIGAQSGEYTIQGENGSSVNITVPATVTLDDGGGNLIIANLFLSQGTATFGVTPITLYIGSDITLTGAELSGGYAGTSTLTVLYQ